MEVPLNFILVLFQTNPSVIVTPSSNHEGLLGLLKEKGNQQFQFHLDLAQIPTAMVEVVKQKEFSLDFSRSNLLKIELPAMPIFQSSRDKFLYLASFINLDNLQMVCRRLYYSLLSSY